MKLETLDFVKGAQAAKGVVIVIDVFRAFSVACYAFAQGASRIMPVGEIDEALRLQKEIPGSILMGERGGKKVEGFDYGNSPTEIQAADFSDQTVIHTTHAGTQGLVNASQAETLLTGAFVNTVATVRYVKSLSAARVTLVRMGYEAKERTSEDDLCAEYLKSLLLDLPFNLADVKEKLRVAPTSARFFDPQKPWSPPTDFELCLDIDRFDFAVQALRDEKNFLYLKRTYL